MRDLGFFSRSSARLSPDQICRTRGDTLPAFSARATSSSPPVRLRARGPRNACGRYERGHPIRDRDTGAAAVHPRWPRRTVYQPQSHCAFRLGVHERRQQLGEPVLHVARPVESALEQRLESLLRFRPRQRCGKGVEGVEKAVGRRQRHLVNEILRRSDRTPIEGSDSPRERIHETIQLAVRKCTIDVSVALSGLAVEVVPAEHDFECATAADEKREAFGTAAAGMHPRPDFDLSQGRVLARCESHVAGEEELAADAPGPASDLRDAYDRRPGETDEGIHQDWQAGRPGSVDQAEAPREVAQIEVGKIELRIRTLEYDDTKARAGVHSTEQILEAFEHANVDYVKGWIVEHDPPVRRRFLDDPHGCC